MVKHAQEKQPDSYYKWPNQFTLSEVNSIIRQVSTFGGKLVPVMYINTGWAAGFPYACR